METSGADLSSLVKEAGSALKKRFFQNQKYKN